LRRRVAGFSAAVDNPASTGAATLVVMHATLKPGESHPFHVHPDQDEVVHVLTGRVEKWIDREMRMIGPGDSAIMPAGVVHGIYNGGGETACVLAIFGPAVGDGFTVLDRSGDEPWRSLRA
jgi:quercetin dioxygenase-like cupin family protein